MAIHGNTWQYMAIHGKTWQYMATHGNLTWLYMAIHVHGYTWLSRTSPHPCVGKTRGLPHNYFILKKCGVCIETMAAANFSKDVLEMFYGPISNEDQQRLRPPIRPRRRLDFEIVRNNFNECLRVWKMDVSTGNSGLLKFFQKTKTRFMTI